MIVVAAPTVPGLIAPVTTPILYTSKGLSVLEAGSPLAVIVPGVTVDPVVVDWLQHNNFVLVTFVRGSYDGVKFYV